MRIDGALSVGQLAIPPAPANGKGAGFEELLQQFLRDTNQLQLDAERTLERVAAGEDLDPAAVAAAVNKAELAFRTMIQIRNKLVQAFQELRQLQV
jgi:flagellar hook-basal body complex protein FliE